MGDGTCISVSEHTYYGCLDRRVARKLVNWSEGKLHICHHTGLSASAHTNNSSSWIILHQPTQTTHHLGYFCISTHKQLIILDISASAHTNNSSSWIFLHQHTQTTHHLGYFCISTHKQLIILDISASAHKNNSSSWMFLHQFAQPNSLFGPACSLADLGYQSVERAKKNITFTVLTTQWEIFIPKELAHCLGHYPVWLYPCGIFPMLLHTHLHRAVQEVNYQEWWRKKTEQALSKFWGFSSLTIQQQLTLMWCLPPVSYENVWVWF